jgi:hypothetical protein
VTVLTFAVRNDRIAGIEVLADRDRLSRLEVVVSADDSRAPGSWA